MVVLRAVVGGRYVWPRAGVKFGSEEAVETNLLRELRTKS